MRLLVATSLHNTLQVLRITQQQCCPLERLQHMLMCSPSCKQRAVICSIIIERRTWVRLLVPEEQLQSAVQHHS